MERLINSIYKLRFFSWLIAFFIGGIFYSLTCKASSAPQLSQATLQLIEGGNNSLFNSSFSAVDCFPEINLDAAKLSELVVNASGNPTLIGAQLNLVPTSDINIRPLTQTEIFDNSGIYPYLYDSSGNIVQWDNVYFAHYDNGFCHGELYVDSSGNILTIDSEKTLTLFQLGLGGKLLGVDELSNIYDLISTQLNNQEFNISTDNIDLSNNKISLYYIYGYVSGGTREAWEVYLPNAYDFGNQVALNPFRIDSNYVWSWGNNNGAPPPFTRRIQGQYNFDFLWSYWTNPSTNGYTYQRSYNLTSTNTKITWGAFQSIGNGRYLINYNGWEYDQNTADSLKNTDIVTFKPLQMSDGSTKTLQFDDTYSYDEISELEQELNNVQPTTNTNFNPESDVDKNNYPFTYPFVNTPVEPSNLPFPNTNPSPSPTPEYDPQTNPSIQNPYPDVDPASINNSIPIIQGLQNKFPFSIPWDIYNLVKGLSAERQAPVLDFEITFPVINYTWNPVIDLSMFNTIAELLRTLLLILFIIGLAIFSYNHFFGT